MWILTKRTISCRLKEKTLIYMSTKISVYLRLLVMNDLKIKLKLFLKTPMPRDIGRLGHLRDVTKDNICCEFLSPFIQSIGSVDSISMKIFMVNKDIIHNLPIILNDLKEYLMKRQDDILHSEASNFKGTVMELQNASTDFKTTFISNHWSLLAKKRISVPDVVKEVKPVDIQNFFPLTQHLRLVNDMDQMDESKLKLTHMSDYWKTRIRHTAEFLGELHKPLPLGKYGTKFIPPRIKKMIANNTCERIPYIKTSFKD